MQTAPLLMQKNPNTTLRISLGLSFSGGLAVFRAKTRTSPHTNCADSLNLLERQPDCSIVLLVRNPSFTSIEQPDLAGETDTLASRNSYAAILPEADSIKGNYLESPISKGNSSGQAWEAHSFQAAFYFDDNLDEWDDEDNEDDIGNLWGDD